MKLLYNKYMMISTEQFNELRFGQQIGLDSVPVQVQGALLLGKSEILFKNTRELNGKLFLFRHLRAEVFPLAISETIEEGSILINFERFEQHNVAIVRTVMELTCAGISSSTLEKLYTVIFRRYTNGKLTVTNKRRRAHIEKLL